MPANFTRAAMAMVFGLLLFSRALLGVRPRRRTSSAIPCRGARSLGWEPADFAPGETISDCAFSPDGKILATAGDSVCLWNAASGALIRRDSFVQTGKRNFHPGSKIFFTENGNDTSCATRTAFSFATHHPADACGPAPFGVDIAVSSDGKRLAAETREALTIWSLDMTSPRSSPGFPAGCTPWASRQTPLPYLQSRVAGSAACGSTVARTNEESIAVASIQRFDVFSNG